jgi:hypothetical protein
MYFKAVFYFLGVLIGIVSANAAENSEYKINEYDSTNISSCSISQQEVIDFYCHQLCLAHGEEQGKSIQPRLISDLERNFTSCKEDEKVLILLTQGTALKGSSWVRFSPTFVEIGHTRVEGNDAKLYGIIAKHIFKNEEINYMHIEINTERKMEIGMLMQAGAEPTDFFKGTAEEEKMGRTAFRLNKGLAIVFLQNMK